MWLLYPLVAVAGAGLYELLIRPAPKTEVVQFTQSSKVYNLSESALRAAKIDYESSTDGVNSWIMVKAKDRTAAVQAILAAARGAAGTQ